MDALAGVADLLLKYSQFTRKKLEMFLLMNRHEREKHRVVVLSLSKVYN